MSKVCCVGDANVYPKSSSCSMVLRSACSHGHSHDSSAVKGHFHDSTNQKRKSASRKTLSSKNSVSLESALESSFKQLALKSAEKTYSLLKEGFYNSFELSDTADQKVYQVSSLKVSCAKELQFSPLSSSDDSHVFNNVSYNKENSSDYIANQSDINSSESLDSTSSMSSYSRRFTRSSVSSVRNLSGSEGEDDITVQRVVRTGRNVSESNNSLNSSASYNNSRHNIYRENELNGLFANNLDSHYESQNILNSHLTRFSDHSSEDSPKMIDPLQLGRSTIQYSVLDRFRWFLWKWAYLKIIKTISFDVWLLSSVRDYGKSKVIFCLLLPLLLFLVWGIFQHTPVSPISFEDVSEAIKSASSFVHTFWSSLFSSFYSYLVHEEKEEVIVESESCEETCNMAPSGLFSIFTSLAGVFSAVPAWFVRDRSDSSGMEYQYENEGSQNYKAEENVNLYQPSREEMKILAAQFFKEEISSLKEFIKNSVHESKADNVKKELKLQNEMKNLQLEVQSLSGILERLETDIQTREEKNQKTENINVLTSEYRKDIDHLHVKLKSLETKLGVLEQLKSCCDKQLRAEDIMILLEKHLLSAFRTVVNGDADPASKYYFFNEWLNSKFFSHEKLMQEINAALKKQSLHAEKPLNYDYVMKVVESTVVKHVDSIKKNLTDMNMFSYSSFTDDYFSEDKIKKIVKEAIMLYDADKTGQVDYALESGGGSVLGTRCSETYVEKYGKISFFGIPVWTSSNSPRTAIQPDVQPGRCWAFKGSQGFLVLELSATIYPSGFTMEHIPVSLSPTGSIDSAPKGFSVWGLESDKDSKGTLLGEYVYTNNGEPLQYFPIQRPSEQPYTYIELQIHSNHGNLEYTCLYRFRVHGRRHA